MSDDRERQLIVVRDFARWIGRYAELIERDVDRLTELDAAIGDGDHGVNMQRGAAAIRRQDRELWKVGTCARLFHVVGHIFLADVGGAAGVLYGTFFQVTGENLGESQCVDARHFATALGRGLTALMRRGKAETGDKTMVDAMAPALVCLAKEIDAAASVAQAVASACEAAAAGSRHATSLVARRGRASYLGPRAVGHEDPGAASTVLLFEALRAVDDVGTSHVVDTEARVGILLVSRSEAVAIGTAEVAGGMAPSVRIVPLGLEEPWDACAQALLRGAIREADEGAGVVAFVDAVGAWEWIGQTDRQATRVRVSRGPFVEGAVMAAVLAEARKSLSAVVTGSEAAAMLEKQAFDAGR